MIARCARCQGTFTTDRFGLQTCPHCGSELLLQDPSAPAGEGAGAAQPPPPPPQPPAGAPPAQGGYAGGAVPPPPPPGGWGPPPGGWPPPPPGGWGAPPPAPPPAELPAPFAERRRRGFFASFFETWKLVATQPQDFFRRVRTDQTGSAVLFGVIASTVGSVVSGLFSLATGEQSREAIEKLFEGMSPEQLEAARRSLELLPQITVASIVATPILAAIGIYLSAAVLHLLLTLFRGASRGFDATLTVVAYAAGLGLLVAIPTCGAVLAAVWWLVVLVAGLGEAQRCGQGKAAAAVIAPAVLACVCCCVAPIGLTFPALLKGIGEVTGQGTVKL